MAFLSEQEQAFANQAAAVREVHRQMDQQGVSHSTYGQATRERYIRETMGTPHCRRRQRRGGRRGSGPVTRL